MVFRKHHKHRKRDDREKYRSPSPSDANGKDNTEEISIEEEEVYLTKEPDNETNSSKDTETSLVQKGKSEESLSIEETNKLREKLGLKPLNVGNSSSGSDPSVKAEFVHAPAEDLWKKKKETEIREKLNSRKQKRLIEQKMSKVYYF